MLRAGELRPASALLKTSVGRVAQQLTTFHVACHMTKNKHQTQLFLHILTFLLVILLLRNGFS
jgi:hypothetical protein